MAIPAAYSATRVQRSPPSLPFGWEAVTVLLIGALLTIVGIVLIVYAFFGFITGTVGAAMGGGGVMGILSTMMGTVILLVIGGVLAGIGGWLVRLWWIFLLVGVGAGSTGNTARDREAVRTSEVRVRCQNCSRLNPEWVKFCMSCGKPV
ncbi:MAG: hypothetical protein ACREDF_04320 [Thermoplasmata archaeon]